MCPYFSYGNCFPPLAVFLMVNFFSQDDHRSLPEVVNLLSKNFATNWSPHSFTKPSFRQVKVALANLDPTVYGQYQVNF